MALYATCTMVTKTDDDKEIDDLLSKASVWLGKAMKQLDCEAPISVTSVKCRQLNKENLVSLFSDAFQLVRFQNDKLRNNRSALNKTKSELVVSQKQVIELQDKLLVCKDQQLTSVQTAVSASVSETVKAEIKSYSEVVKESSNPSISSETLKHVVKSAVQEEDRSKHIMVFGLPEQQNEDLSGRVGELFEQLGLKPAMEMCRVGRTGNETRPRPVKVNLSNSSTARHVLTQARKLRHSETFKSVFIRPDRSPEERASHKLLIEELKRRKEADPDKRHYIKGGSVFTEEVGQNSLIVALLNFLKS